MDEHNLDRHLKAYCDMHEEYQNLYATWSLNRKSCSEILKKCLVALSPLQSTRCKPC